MNCEPFCFALETPSRIMLNLPKIGFSVGDPNGIGVEILLKLFSQPELYKDCIPVVYAPLGVLSHYKDVLGARAALSDVPSAKAAEPAQLNVVQTATHYTPQPGVADTAGGIVAFESLEAAVADLQTADIAALVTLPINKAVIQQADFAFPGHTEYLADRFGVKENMMLFVYREFRLTLVTAHLPLGKVADAISQARVLDKLRMLHAVLRSDFGIAAPKIAVLGLNPHAGDAGLLGSEEHAIIEPAVAAANELGIDVLGPFPADGFFVHDQYRHYDATLAMYHDQGLIPFKHITQGAGVNYTAGMPIIRTSPDHGTAYDIAGEGKADPTSTQEAIRLALDLVKRRG